MMRAKELGAFSWLLAAQFFVVQIVVATAWRRPFSLRADFISDLGNSACTASICSPWHAAMNLSFVFVGITMAVGAVLARSAFASSWRRSLAILLFVVAGVGVVMVGAYPENENNDLHVLGATINFAAGNTALIHFGLVSAGRLRGRGFTTFSILAGIVGLVSSALLAAHLYGALGVGTIERLAAYPMPIWQIVAGMLILTGGPGDGSGRRPVETLPHQLGQTRE